MISDVLSLGSHGNYHKNIWQPILSVFLPSVNGGIMQYISQKMDKIICFVCESLEICTYTLGATYLLLHAGVRTNLSDWSVM